MVPKKSRHSRSEDLVQAIERQIVQRAWGRVHCLAVEVTDDRVVVRGYTQTHYCKQLALKGVRDVVGDSTRVELDVQVCPCSARTIQRRTPTLGRPGSAAG